MVSRVAHILFFFIFSIIASALDFDSTDSFEDNSLFIDTGSTASLDQKAPSMFDLTDFPSSTSFLPMDSSSGFFLDEDLDSNDIDVQSPSSQNDDNAALLSLFSEPAHVDDENFDLDDATSGSLIAAVDGTSFFPNGENAGGGDDSEIADLSGIDQQLLLNPLGAISRDRGKINPYCSLYTQTFNPVGLCVPSVAENQVELPRLRGLPSPNRFNDYKFWDVNHATYGTFSHSD